MVRDVQSLTLRRDLVEEKETQLKSFIKSAVEAACPLQKLCLQFSVMADHGNLISALMAGACDLIAQTGTPADLWSCLMLHYESVDGKKQWLLDPSFEECCNLSNNLVLVTKIGDKFSVQVGADQNRTSYSVHNSPTLNFKQSSIAFQDLKEAIKFGQTTCQKALMQMPDLTKTDYEVTL